MANTFRKGIDRMRWSLAAPSPNAHAIGGSLASDLRSDISRNPFIYQLVSATVLNRYNFIMNSWQALSSPALAGTYGAGATAVFAPSQAVKGTLAAGATTTKVVISTALPTAIGVNMLANSGGSGERGYKLRIIGKASGKTEERFIVGNTAGTTPTIYLDNALTFTPAVGDEYEILSGRLFMLSAGTTAANIWRSLEVGCNTLSTGLSTTNLPATIGTDSEAVALDEQYTPYDCEPGEGFIKGAYKYDSNVTDRYALTATATAAGTLTGQAALGDATVLANEYRNFQIRIVEDTGAPTAVGQRRIIASHTGGASPVYTLGTAWTVTPSSTAKYVIEFPNLILLRSSATTTVYVYNYNNVTIDNGTNTIAANSWSTTYFAVAPAAHAAGCLWMPSYGVRPDEGKNSRHSFCYFLRGTSSVIDVLDIAGGTTGAWSAAAVYDGVTTVTAASNGCYAPCTDEGRFYYINNYATGAINQMLRFDVQNRVLSPFVSTDWTQSGTAVIGQRTATICAFNGSDKYTFLYNLHHISTIGSSLVVVQ